MQKNDSNQFVIDTTKILDIILAFNDEVDYTELLENILVKMMGFTNSDAGTLYITSQNKLHFCILKNNTLGISRIIDAAEEADLPPIELNEKNIENISAYSAIHNESVIIDDVYTDNRFNFKGPKKYDELTGYRTRSMLVLPLCSDFNKGTQDVLGVIQLLNATNPETNEPMSYSSISPPNLMTALSRIAANTLANFIHMREIHNLFLSLIQVTTVALDERSNATRNHTQHVSTYAEAFASHLSTAFPDEDHPFHFNTRHKERLAIAALLHDVGKIITPTEILDKSTRLYDVQFSDIKYRFAMKKSQIEIDYLSGKTDKNEYEAAIDEANNFLDLITNANSSKPLTDDEFEAVLKLADYKYINIDGEQTCILSEDDIKSLSIKYGTLTAEERDIMQDHVSATGRLLAQVKSWKHYEGVAKWARDHHEFLDGSGYPNGLSGDDICVESQILTILDIFEALTSDERPYRRAMPPERAISILHEMADEGKLNKELVNALSESQIWKGLKDK